MNKLRLLSDRMGDLVGRRVELRFRVADAVKAGGAPAAVLEQANEIAAVSERIGEIKVAIGEEWGRIEAERIGRTRAAQASMTNNGVN